MTADAAVTQAFTDATNAYNTTIALTPDQTITGDINSTTTINATHGGQYVIRITGDIKKHTDSQSGAWYSRPSSSLSLKVQ